VLSVACRCLEPVSQTSKFDRDMLMGPDFRKNYMTRSNITLLTND